MCSGETMQLGGGCWCDSSGGWIQTIPTIGDSIRVRVNYGGVYRPHIVVTGQWTPPPHTPSEPGAVITTGVWATLQTLPQVAIVSHQRMSGWSREMKLIWIQTLLIKARRPGSYCLLTT